MHLNRGLMYADPCDFSLNVARLCEVGGRTETQVETGNLETQIPSSFILRCGWHRYDNQHNGSVLPHSKPMLRTREVLSFSSSRESAQSSGKTCYLPYSCIPIASVTGETASMVLCFTDPFHYYQVLSRSLLHFVMLPRSTWTD